MLDKGSQSNANYNYNYNNYFDIYFNDILKATPMKYDQFKFEIAFCLLLLLPLLPKSFIISACNYRTTLN